jgi:RND family efflux transporter MFP subunit
MYIHLYRTRWILVVGLLLAGGGALAMYGGRAAEGEGPRQLAVGRPVLIATVAPANRSTSTYTGVVAARTDSGLGFRVRGKIVERRVDPGDRVARGDTLLVLDVEDFELQLRAARNRLRAAESQLRQAQDDERRYRRLAAADAAAPRTYELASTSLDIAQAEAAAARAEASQIENRRNYSTLQADGDGVITEVLVERGQVVSEGQIVVRLAHDGAREAVIDIPETQLELARAANRAHAFSFDNSRHVVDAALRELSAAADPVTRTFRARYVLADDGASFPIGSTVTVRLASDAASDLSRVPIGALHDPGDGVGVWRIEADRRVRFAPVRVVELAQEHASVASGVAVGDAVVALGAHLLHEGDLVRPVGDEAGDSLGR